MRWANNVYSFFLWFSRFHIYYIVLIPASLFGFKLNYLQLLNQKLIYKINTFCCRFLVTCHTMMIIYSEFWSILFTLTSNNKFISSLLIPVLFHTHLKTFVFCCLFLRLSSVPIFYYIIYILLYYYYNILYYNIFIYYFYF